MGCIMEAGTNTHLLTGRALNTVECEWACNDSALRESLQKRSTQARQIRRFVFFGRSFYARSS